MTSAWEFSVHFTRAKAHLTVLSLRTQSCLSGMNTSNVFTGNGHGRCEAGGLPICIIKGEEDC